MTDKDLDKLFKDKLSGTAYSYEEGAWERAQSQWTTQKSVDQIFKDGLAGNSYPYNPSAWAAAEKLIVADARKTLYKRLAAAAAVLLLFGAGWALFSADINGEFANREKKQFTQSTAKEENNLGNDLNPKETKSNTDFNTNPAQEAEKPESSAPSAKSDLNTAGLATGENKTAQNKRSSQIKAGQSSNLSSVLNDARADANPSYRSSSNDGGFGASNGISTLENSASNDLALSDILQREEDTEFDNKIEKMAFAQAPTFKKVAGENLPLRGNHKFGKFKRWFVELNAGLNLARPYENGQNASGNTTPLYLFGVGLNRELNNRFTLETGVIYYARLAQNTDRIIEQVAYSFSLQETNTTLNPRSLHYIGMPLLANYNVFDKHYIGIGAQLAYLVDSRTKVNTVESTNEVVVNEVEQEGWGYTEGFNRFDAGLLLNYHYLLTDRLKLGLSLNYGLLDVTPNDIYGNSFDDRNVQLMVRLKYRALNF